MNQKKNEILNELIKPDIPEVLVAGFEVIDDLVDPMPSWIVLPCIRDDQVELLQELRQSLQRPRLQFVPDVSEASGSTDDLQVVWVPLSVDWPKEIHLECLTLLQLGDHIPPNVLSGFFLWSHLSDRKR